MKALLSSAYNYNRCLTVAITLRSPFCSVSSPSFPTACLARCRASCPGSPQVGQHNEKRASYGHSLIVDPWGKVLADAGGEESPCIRTAEIGAHHQR